MHNSIPGLFSIGFFPLLILGGGGPKKIEEISFDTTRAISLTESRDLEGGIEVGLALPKPEMDAFVTLFTEGLKALASM